MNNLTLYAKNTLLNIIHNYQIDLVLHTMPKANEAMK